MKLTKTANTKIKPGMTLIEITVVILVLLTLIAVLFIGANIYKRGADRAACILNIRNIHQAIRADQNLKGAAPGDNLATIPDPASSTGGTLPGDIALVLYGTGKYFEVAPDCPTDAGAYTPANAASYPAIGTVGVSCSTNGASGTASGSPQDHFPTDTQAW